MVTVVVCLQKHAERVTAEPTVYVCLAQISIWTTNIKKQRQTKFWGIIIIIIPFKIYSKNILQSTVTGPQDINYNLQIWQEHIGKQLLTEYVGL